MAFLTSLFTFAFAIHIFLGIYTLVLIPRRQINVLFFICALLMAAMCLTAAISQSAPNQETVWKLFKWGMYFSFGFIAVLLMILLVLIKNITLKKIHWVVVFIPTITGCIYTFMSKPLWQYINVDGIWYQSATNNHIKHALFLSYFSFCYLGFLIAIGWWYRNAPTNKTKKQAGIIFVSLLFPPLLGAIEKAILIQLPIKLINENYPLYLTFFAFGIWLAIVRYRLLTISPEIVSKELMDSISESMVLIDANKKVISVNKSIIELIGSSKKPVDMTLGDIIDQKKSIIQEIDELFLEKRDIFFCRLFFHSQRIEKPLMDCRFSLVRDKFNDILGILLIGREIPGVSQLKKDFHLTERETEIIQHLISGKTNRENALELGISENTIKRHIHNIYNKLGINNKVDLINLLKEYKIEPLG